MKYFAKYLSIEGEIKEGDKTMESNGNVLPYTISKDEIEFAKSQGDKVCKLFLCSRDNPNLPIAPISEKAKFVKENDELSKDNIRFLQKPLFKENWKDLPFQGKQRKTGEEREIFPHSPSFSNYSWEIINPSAEQLVVEVKCPCCDTFM